MRPEALDQRITLQRATSVANGMGGQTVTWADIASVPKVWAQVRSGGGREGMVADQMQAHAAYSFTLRYRADLTEADRIVWQGVPYNIRQIERRGGREMYMVIHAERGVAD